MSHHKKPVQPLPPRDKLFVTAGNLEDPKHRAVLNKAVVRQPFISHLGLCFSTNSSNNDLPAELKHIIERHTFSHARLNPSDLLCSEFMNSYLRGKSPGSLILLSANGSPEDVLAIDGKGHLVLSLCKDSHSIFGWPGHPSGWGPKYDRYYVEIDLTPDFMRAGKPGFERIRAGLRKLGDKDFIATYVDAEGEAAKVDFPSTAATKSVLKPRVSCTSTKLDPTSDLVGLQEKLSRHDFRNSKARKRKRNDEQDGEESDILIQELLEAVASVDKLSSPAPKKGDTSVVSISIDGMLHPHLAQEVLQFFSISESYTLIALTSQTMSHSPLERPIKRQSGTQPYTRGKEERPIDSGVLDGWSVICGSPKDGKTRFVFVDSATS